MARPRLEHPTPAELEVLQVLWRRGPSLGRDVLDELSETRPRAYTTVMSLLNVMTDKDLLTRHARGRAFVYAAKVGRERTLRRIVGDVVERAFDGSAGALVAELLAHARPDEDELAEIRRTINSYRKDREQT